MGQSKTSPIPSSSEVKVNFLTALEKGFKDYAYFHMNSQQKDFPKGCHLVLYNPQAGEIWDFQKEKIFSVKALGSPEIFVKPSAYSEEIPGKIWILKQNKQLQPIAPRFQTLVWRQPGTCLYWAAGHGEIPREWDVQIPDYLKVRTVAHNQEPVEEFVLACEEG